MWILVSCFFFLNFMIRSCIWKCTWSGHAAQLVCTIHSIHQLKELVSTASIKVYILWTLRSLWIFGTIGSLMTKNHNTIWIIPDHKGKVNLCSVWCTACFSSTVNSYFPLSFQDHDIFGDNTLAAVCNSNFRILPFFP